MSGVSCLEWNMEEKTVQAQGQYWIEYLYSTNNSNYQYGHC